MAFELLYGSIVIVIVIVDEFGDGSDDRNGVT